MNKDEGKNNFIVDKRNGKGDKFIVETRERKQSRKEGHIAQCRNTTIHSTLTAI